MREGNLFFLAHLSTECSVSYCDHSPSISVCPSLRLPSVHLSAHHFLINTLGSTNINQSAPNLVKMYMTIRSRMSVIMDLIGPELFELSALELENLPYLTFLQSSTCKYRPISTKLGHKIYAF